MTMTVAGDAAAAEHAFGVTLRVFRSPSGRTFQAPASAIRLPAAIAGAVRTVGGLGSGVRLLPAAGRPKLHRPAAEITPTCAGATTAQRTLGGYLPADLGQPGAYGQNSLIGAGADGSGEVIGMVEFSAYARGDVNHFRRCFPGITGTYSTDAIVGSEHPGHEREDGGRTRPGGGDGRRARRRPARLHRAERPELRARDPRSDAPGRRRHHQRQLGCLRAADHTGPAHGREYLAPTGRGRRHLDVCGHGRLRSDRLLPLHRLGQSARRRSLVTAVCNGGRRDGAPGAAGVPEEQGDGVARIWRWRLDVVAEARLPGRKDDPGRRAQMPQRAARLPGDARHLTRCPPEAHGLHHLLQSLRRRPGPRLGAGRRHERGGAAHGGPHRGRRRGGGQAARLRKPVSLCPSRNQCLPRHRYGHEQHLRRPPLHGGAGLRHGDRARLGPGRSVRHRSRRIRARGGDRRCERPARGRPRERQAHRVRTPGHLPRHADRHDHVPADRKRAGAGGDQRGLLPCPHQRPGSLVGEPVEGDPA